jgi:hypothetical protein
MTKTERFFFFVVTALFAILVGSQTYHYLNGECFDTHPQAIQESE